MKRERVRFVDNDCAFDAGRFDAAAREAQYSRIGEHLHRALHSAGTDKGPLRAGGALVRLGTQMGADATVWQRLFARPPYFEYSADPSTGSRGEAVWEDETVSSSISIALLLSVVIGVLVALGLLVGTTRYYRAAATHSPHTATA